MEKVLSLARSGDFEAYEQSLALDEFAVKAIALGTEEKAREDWLAEHEYRGWCQLELQTFDNNFAAQHPDQCIRVEHNNYRNPSQRMTELFVTESAKDKWLNAHYSAEWNSYCQGYGDPTLGYMEIEIFYPDGRVEKIGD